MKKALLLVGLLALTACTDPKGAQTYLQDHGYQNIETGGYNWFLANKGDVTVTSFKATNSTTGRTEEGTVSYNFGFLGIGARWSIKVEKQY